MKQAKSIVSIATVVLVAAIATCAAQQKNEPINFNSKQGGLNHPNIAAQPVQSGQFGQTGQFGLNSQPVQVGQQGIQQIANNLGSGMTFQTNNRPSGAGTGLSRQPGQFVQNSQFGQASQPGSQQVFNNPMGGIGIQTNNRPSGVGTNVASQPGQFGQSGQIGQTGIPPRVTNNRPNPSGHVGSTIAGPASNFL